MLAPPRVLFSGLVDDAALFPPRAAEAASAVAAHLTWQASPNHDLLGPLVCPASRVHDISLTLPVDNHLQIALVLDGDAALLRTALHEIADDPRLILVAVEAAHNAMGDETNAVGMLLSRERDVVAVLEVPRGDFDDSLTLIEYGPWRLAKYRTGGTVADDYPTEAELAEFLLACCGRGIPFKLTAGLHHAIRNYDHRTDFQQHGVLNVLLATEAALAEDPFEVVVGLLAQRNPDLVVNRFRHWDEDHCEAVRSAFRSFGCCEPGEPIADLRALGLLREWL